MTELYIGILLSIVLLIKCYKYLLFQYYLYFYDNNIFIITDEENWEQLKYFKNVHNIDDSNRFLYALNKCDQDLDLDLIIVANGGNVFESDSILHALCNYKGNINTYVPRNAFSAGSMLSIIGHNIFMDKCSQLSLVDPQISFKDDMFSVKSLMNLYEHKNIDEINDETIAIYYESKLLYEDNIRNMHKILDVRYNRRTVKRVITELGKGIYPHGKQFSREELKEFGLNIKEGIPTKIKNITDLFLDLICI